MVGVKTHNFGVFSSWSLVLLTFTSRRSRVFTSNNLRIQSQISSVETGLRKGSNIAGYSANFPSKPSTCKLEVCCARGVKKTSISLISPETFSDGLT